MKVTFHHTQAVGAASAAADRSTDVPAPTPAHLKLPPHLRSPRCTPQQAAQGALFVAEWNARKAAAAARAQAPAQPAPMPSAHAQTPAWQPHVPEQL